MIPKDIIEKDFDYFDGYTHTSKIEKIIFDKKFAIITENGNYFGIVTSEDIVLKRKNLLIDCVTEKPKISINNNFDEVIKIMEYNQKCVLPVFDENNNFIGVITKKSILDFFIKNISIMNKKSMESDESTNYIPDIALELAHEIRTPLNAIIGFSDILSSIEENQEKRELSEIIKISGNSLLSIINDILDISRIKSKKMPIVEEKFNILDVLKELEDIFTKSLLVKNIKFSINNKLKETFLIGDITKIKRILINLIGNASKFTDNGFITVSIEEIFEDKINNEILTEFHVTDTGIGMNEDELSRLFSKFDQIDKNIYKIYGGSGLGLYIVKELLNMLNGYIYVESEKGLGTSFTFGIPLKINNKNDFQKNQTNIIDSKKNYKVLIVEKEKNIKMLTKFFFERKGCIVEFAEEIEDFENKIKNCRYDHIILNDKFNNKLNYIENNQKILVYPSNFDKKKIIELIYNTI